MIIRALTLADVEFMDGVRADFADGWNKQMLISAFEGGRFIAFGVEDNGLQSFITADCGVDSLDVESVYTLPGGRRKGYAGALVCAVIAYAEQQNIPKIFLEVKAGNTPAISLYQSFGFKQLSVRKKYYSDGADAVVMLREKL